MPRALAERYLWMRNEVSWGKGARRGKKGNGMKCGPDFNGEITVDSLCSETACIGVIRRTGPKTFLQPLHRADIRCVRFSD